MGRREEREKHVPPHNPPPPASPALCLTSELAFGLGGVQRVSRPVPRGWGGAALAGQPHRKDSFEMELAEPGRKPTCRLRLGLSWSLSHVQIRQLLVSASRPERAPKFYSSSLWDTPSALVPGRTEPQWGKGKGTGRTEPSRGPVAKQHDPGPGLRPQAARSSLLTAASSQPLACPAKPSGTRVLRRPQATSS